MYVPINHHHRYVEGSTAVNEPSGKAHPAGQVRLPLSPSRAIAQRGAVAHGGAGGVGGLGGGGGSGGSGGAMGGEGGLTQ